MPAGPPPIRAFCRVVDLMRVKRRDAAWWCEVRQARDQVLKILRAPPDPIVLKVLWSAFVRHLPYPPNPPLADETIWAISLEQVEAWGERLEAGYLRFATEQHYPMTGTA